MNQPQDTEGSDVFGQPIATNEELKESIEKLKNLASYTNPTTEAYEPIQTTPIRVVKNDELEIVLERLSAGIGGWVKINGKAYDGIEADDAKAVIEAHYAEVIRRINDEWFSLLIDEVGYETAKRYKDAIDYRQRAKEEGVEL